MKIRKKMSVLLRIGVLGVCWTVMTTAPLAGAEKKYEYRLKMATMAPKNIGWAKNIREIIHPAVKKITNGKVKLKWYWGGVMGDDKDYIQKMQVGQLDGAGLSGQGTIMAVPEMSVLELPFLFKNFDEVDYVRIKMMDAFDALAVKNGYKIIMWGDQDFDQLYSVKYQLDQVAQFKKARFVTWYGDMEKQVLKKLGSSPVPIGIPEIPAAFRQGIIDSMIAPAVWIVGSQLYTIIKYVNPVQLRYSPACGLVTLKAWEKTPEEYRRGFESMRTKEAIAFVKKCRSDSIKAYNAMLKHGLKPAKMAPAEFQAMEKLCKEVWSETAGKYFDKATLDEVLMHIKDFRAKQTK